MKTKLEAAADAIMEHCYDGAQALSIAQTVLIAAAQHQSLADLVNAEDEDDHEINRILAMSGDELRAELVAEGHDPDALVRQMRQELDGVLRLAADRQRWREEAASWRRVAERLEAQMQALRAKADDQMAYWRKRMAAEKSTDDGFSEDGLTYTPIGDDAAWSGGYCNGRLGEAEWWQSTLKYMQPASGIDARSDETRSGSAEGESPVGNAETPSYTPTPEA